MKILIFNDELRSEMQMYLALSNKHQVEIAADERELFRLLDRKRTDLMFLDLGPRQESGKRARFGFDLLEKITQKHPDLKVVGICDQNDETSAKEADQRGVRQILTRPIKNRELLQLLEI
jgi:DNA-binding NtrC family response regulator